MIKFPPGQEPPSNAENSVALSSYLEEVAEIRTKLGKPTTVQEEAKRFAEQVKPGASILDRLRRLNLIPSVTPTQIPTVGVRV